MILHEEYSSNEESAFPTLIVIGNESEDDDEVVIQIWTGYTLSEFCVTPEVLKDYIETMQRTLDAITSGKFDGPIL